MDYAKRECGKYETKAKLTGWSLNIAIGLQILVGALITGLSAVVTGKNVGLSTSILGGISTLIASYLARVRGSGEPELSTSRVKDLAQFVRECEAFVQDYGYVVPYSKGTVRGPGSHAGTTNGGDAAGGEGSGSGTGDTSEAEAEGRMWEEKINEFRSKLEELLGNGSGERKLAPSV